VTAATELESAPALAPPDEVRTLNRLPFPPFDEETPSQKVQAAEDAWNSRDPRRDSPACMAGSALGNRDTFVAGRKQIVESFEFITAKCDFQLAYIPGESFRGFRRNRIAVRCRNERAEDHEIPLQRPVPSRPS